MLGVHFCLTTSALQHRRIGVVHEFSKRMPELRVELDQRTLHGTTMHACVASIPAVERQLVVRSDDNSIAHEALLRGQ